MIKTRSVSAQHERALDFLRHHSTDRITTKWLLMKTETKIKVELNQIRTLHFQFHRVFFSSNFL